MRFDREQLEQRERATLAPYATFSGDSRGRTYDEPKPSYRTGFQRDRDRILHSAAFRRLEYKTQVFVNDEGDYYRTRLTHTLEVSQIGRTIARALGANEDLVEAICLAHDLGHPPFGHAGENALDRVMAPCGGFNHNVQTYRVLTRLEHRYAGWPGLNLTFETLSGVVSHKATVDTRALLSITDHAGPGLEAQIADAADELAYSAHDLDDGLSAGLLTMDELKQLPRLMEVIGIGRDAPYDASLARHRLVRTLVGYFVDDVLQSTEARLEQLRPASAAEIQMQPEPVVVYSQSAAALREELRAFLFECMYRSYRVVRMAQRAERFVEAMFATLVANPLQLPPDTHAQIERTGLERTVADYIACMTDRSALLEYQRLYDPLTRP